MDQELDKDKDNNGEHVQYNGGDYEAEKKVKKEEQENDKSINKANLKK